MTHINRRAIRFVALATTAVALFSIVQCGGSSTAATSTTAMSVALSPSSVAAGSSAQGTITLTTAAPSGGLNLSVSSSNTAVATVPGAMTIPAGATSGTFTITAVAIGAANISASANGGSAQSSLTVTPRAALASLTLSSATVVGGTSVQGTVTLTGAAPAGGAAVTFTGGDPVIVPVNVVVPAGALSTTFSIETRGVGGTISSTITASAGGGSASVVLSVTRPTIATASFGITGPTETETCAMANAGTTINCTFNGSTSSGPGTIVAWDWTYTVAKTFSQTTTGAALANPTVDCNLLPAPPLPAGANLWLPLTVTLKVHDSLGNVSAVVTDSGARLFPQGSCGY